MVKARHKRALPNGAPDRFRQWLAEDEEASSGDEGQTKVEWGGAGGCTVPPEVKHLPEVDGFKGSIECEQTSERTSQTAAEVSQGVEAGKEENKHGENNHNRNKEQIDKPVGWEEEPLTGEIIALRASEETAQRAGMGRGTAAKVGKSNGPLLKNVAKGIWGSSSGRTQVGDEVRPRGGRSKFEDESANSAKAGVTTRALTDIVGVEANSPHEEESKGKAQNAAPGDKVEVLAEKDSGSDSEDYSSAEEAPGPLVQTYNPFKSKLSSKRPGREDTARKSASLPAQKPGNAATVSKSGSAPPADMTASLLAALKQTVARENGVAAGKPEKAGDSVRKEGNAAAKKEEPSLVEKGSSDSKGSVEPVRKTDTPTPENKSNAIPWGASSSAVDKRPAEAPPSAQEKASNVPERTSSPPSVEQAPSKEGDQTAAKENPQSPKEPSPPRTASPTGARNISPESRVAPPAQVGPSQVARALKQMPGDIVAEIDAIAERITAQAGGGVPKRASDPGLPPRNSISPGAAYLKLHSQGDTSSLKSPESKAKHPLVSSIRDRANSTGSMPEGSAEGKGPMPNFWSRFIPIHAFQPGEGGKEGGKEGVSASPSSAVLEELPEEGGPMDEVRARQNQGSEARVAQRSEISPAGKSSEEGEGNERQKSPPAAEENASSHYARGKSMDSSGVPPSKARTPSSPMSVLPSVEREATSPRSPHSPTKPPLPPILKSSSRFNGPPQNVTAEMVEQLKDLELAKDTQKGEEKPSPPTRDKLSPGSAPSPKGGKTQHSDAAQNPNSTRKDIPSPRRVSFVDDLPTLKKAASFSMGGGGPRGGLPTSSPALSKSTSLPRNSESLVAAAAGGEAKDRGGKQSGGARAKVPDAAEILQTSDTDELLGAFGAAGMDLDGLIKMAEVHLREARKGMSPEAKKRPAREETKGPEPKPDKDKATQKPNPATEEKIKPKGGDAKTPYLSIPDFDEDEWKAERGVSPTPTARAPPREKKVDERLAASPRAWEKVSGREKASKSMDASAYKRASDPSGRRSDAYGRSSDGYGRASDGRERKSDGNGATSDASEKKSDRAGHDSDDFGRSSLERLDPMLDTVLERVLASDNESDDLEPETSTGPVNRSDEVKARGDAKAKDAKGSQEVIFWGAEDEADRDAITKLQREKETLQASLDDEAGKSAPRQPDAEQKRRALRAKRSQLEAEISQLRRKVSLQRSLRSSFTAGWGGGSGDGNRAREDAEIKQLEEEVAKMRKTKEELSGTLETAKEAEGAAERLWELRETRAQLEEDLARLLAQRAAGGFKPPADPEQAKLEAEVARMKQELLDLQKQKAGGGGQGNPQAQLSRLKEERSALEQQLALAIGEIALESAMAPPASSPDEFEELNLGLLEEGNSRLQQQIQEVKQQAARQRAGIIIGSEERTQALQKLLETRNLYEEELAATVQQIMEEKQKNDEIEKMVHGNMSALERALAQQQQALSEAQEVLQAERMRSQTMRASVENISHAAAPAIPGLLKNRSYATSPTGGQKNNHFAINFSNLESGGSDYLSQQLASSRGLVFRDADIRRRMHEEGSDSEQSGSHNSGNSDSYQDSRGNDLALTPTKNRITELPASSSRDRDRDQNRKRPEMLMSNRERRPGSPSGPQLVGGGGLGFQLEHSQERRNQILKQFSGPLDPPVSGGKGPSRMSVATSKFLQRPKSAGPLGGNRYSLG